MMQISLGMQEPILYGLHPEAPVSMYPIWNRWDYLTLTEWIGTKG